MPSVDTDYEGHRQILLPDWDFNLEAYATNKFATQIIWPDLELNRGHVGYTCQVAHTVILTSVPLGQMQPTNQPTKPL